MKKPKKMPRNYTRLPLPDEYPLQEPYFPYGTNFGGVLQTLRVEPTERTTLRKKQSKMKFIDKVAPQAVNTYLHLEEARKKKWQKANKERGQRMSIETDQVKLDYVRKLNKLNKK